MPDIEWVRVTDEVKPKREYSVVASAVVEGVHTVLKDKPGANPDGTPVPPKYTPEALAGQSGQTATTTKEK